MPGKRFAPLFIMVALVFMSACNLPEVLPVQGGTAPAPNVPLETQVAQMVASTLTAQAQLAIAATSTQAAQASDTPAFTSTPSLTPTQTFTLTPTVPMVSVSVTTNCRTGPNTAYDILGVMKVGEKAEVVGRSNLISNTLIIKLPSNPAITCWLWGQNATVTGDISKLPVVPIPPTPTPKFTATPELGFNLTYASLAYCSGQYRIKFRIANTGGLTLESNRVTVTNQDTSVTKKITYDNFPYYSTTCDQSADKNLEAGEAGFTTSDGFVNKPTGDKMVATIRACSKDGLAGTCLDKTISFTP